MGHSWDAYLTARDKEHLAASRWRKSDLFGFGEKPALLIIDDYYSVIGETREPLLESVKRWPMSCGEEGWEAIDKTVPLLKAARDNGVLVVYVHGLEQNSYPWNRRPMRGDRGLSPEQKAIANTIIDEIAPLPGEMVIEKSAASAFFGTHLIAYLNYHGIDTVICAGETTSGCVRASVVDAAMYRFNVGVVEECCFDRTQASHYINLFDMHQKYADVIDLDAAIAYFDTIGARKAPVMEAVSLTAR